MQILALLKDGTTTSVPCVKWHPERSRPVDRPDGFAHLIEPAGLWTTVESLKKHLENVNRYRTENGMEPRSLDDVAGMIDFAEAPFELYLDCEDGEPWRHNGLLVRGVKYGGDPEFWNSHA